MDPPEQGATLVSALELGFPILSDPDAAALKAFGVLDDRLGVAWPATFIVAPSGTIVWRSLEDSYKQRPEAATVLEALAEVRRAQPAAATGPLPSPAAQPALAPASAPAQPTSMPGEPPATQQP